MSPTPPPHEPPFEPPRDESRGGSSEPARTDAMPVRQALPSPYPFWFDNVHRERPWPSRSPIPITGPGRMKGMDLPYIMRPLPQGQRVLGQGYAAVILLLLFLLCVTLPQMVAAKVADPLDPVAPDERYQVEAGANAVSFFVPEGWRVEKPTMMNTRSFVLGRGETAPEITVVSKDRARDFGVTARRTVESAGVDGLAVILTGAPTEIREGWTGQHCTVIEATAQRSGECYMLMQEDTFVFAYGLSGQPPSVKVDVRAELEKKVAEDLSDVVATIRRDTPKQEVNPS